MIKSFIFYSSNNLFRLLSAWLLLATVFASGQTQTVNLTASGTYTVPQGVTSLTVEAWGGGGGGGRSTSSGQTTGGGGGGAYASLIASVAANSTISYLIGSGGSSGDNNKNGKDTWFINETTVLAKGGAGVITNTTAGAEGGRAAQSKGTTRYNGGNGGNGTGKGGKFASGGGGGAAFSTQAGGKGGNGINGTGIFADFGGTGGAGGSSSSPGGTGNSGAGSDGVGLDGYSYGGAGGGAKKGAASLFDRNGGSGAQGLIRLRFTKPSININPFSITICRGSDVSLTASSAGAYSYSWSNGAGNGATVTVSPTNTTIYTVTGTAPNGAGGTFTHTQTITVTVVDPVANIDFTQAPFPTGATACNLQYMKINTNVSVIYTPTTGLYQDAARTIPYTGSSVMEIYAAPNGTQTYTATATNGACSKTNTITITRTPAIPVSVTQIKFPTGVDACNLDYVQLIANQAAVFSPVTGLYTDSTFTVPYTGTSVTTVYAAPDGTQSYTATAGLGTCTSVSSAVLVSKTKKVFASDIYEDRWDVGENWFPASIPTSDKCIFIPSGKFVSVPASVSGFARSVTVENGGGLVVKTNGNLTISNRLVNQDPSGDNITIESDANLVQASNISNQGAITAKRAVDLSGTYKQYNYLISPLIGQKMKYIFGANASGTPFVQYVLRLNESTSLFVNDGDGNYVKGKGFSVKEPNATYTGTEAIFKGVPQNGDFDYDLSFSASNRGYNLTGNPYPSNIDLYELYQNSKNPVDDTYYIDSTIHFWDSEANNIFEQQGGKYQGYAYAYFNANAGSHGSGTPAPGGNGMAATGKTPNYIVKPGQGFMVRAKYEGAKLLFKNWFRITDQTESVFFGKNSEMDKDDRYWLEFHASSGVVISNAIVYFNAGNNDFSTDDTKIPSSTSSDALFTYAGEAKVIINGRSAFNIQDILTVGTRNFVSGTYSFKLGNKEGIFKNGQSIYLKDKELGILTDLTAGDYVFTSEAGEFTNRFEIVYENGLVLSTDTPKNSPINIFRDANDFVVKSSDKMIKNIEIFDASGRMIRTISGKSKELRFESGQFIAGIYILKVALQGGETFTKKIRK